jgi:lipopolysaccharide/colanic/teichoic acid biosynthesis glycosyltransferase
MGGDGAPKKFGIRRRFVSGTEDSMSEGLLPTYNLQLQHENLHQPPSQLPQEAPSSHILDVGIKFEAPLVVDRKRVQLLLKRMADVVVASLLLLLVLPVMLAIVAVLFLQGGRPFFIHRRIGQGGRTFGCMKFRTMIVNSDAVLSHHLATDRDAAAEWAMRRKLAVDPRVTRLGTFLRETSLDELPQLVNVLRGEMSLVGPRPVVRAELDDHYGDAERLAYTTMRPGLTGLWQVSGRSETSFARRVALDTQYVNDWSLILDLKILTATIPVVLLRQGAI